jgi:drug/metabolite transporter (DMT)-like permease
LSLAVMSLVLLGAVLHASWNVIIKAGSDKQLDTMLVICGGAILAAFALPFIPLPERASWPYLGASVIFGTVLACLFLEERFGLMRYAAAVLVTAGGVAIKVF